MCCLVVSFATIWTSESRSLSNACMAQTEQEMGKAHALERYREGVRGALRGGGCCASRAMFVGACLGARGGADAVPVRWRKRFRKHRECFALTERLCALRD